MDQMSFGDAEYAAKRKKTRRERKRGHPLAGRCQASK